MILDDALLAHDHLVRGLHRNRDGHLAATPRTHVEAVTPMHNAAIIYYYAVVDTAAEDMLVLRTHYTHTLTQRRSYSDWRQRVYRVVDYMNRINDPSYYGAYGWVTTSVSITPMRKGDMFICVDSNGVRSARLAFNPDGHH